LGALQVAAKYGGQVMKERLKPRFWVQPFLFPHGQFSEAVWQGNRVVGWRTRQFGSDPKTTADRKKAGGRAGRRVKYTANAEETWGGDRLNTGKASKLRSGAFVGGGARRGAMQGGGKHRAEQQRSKSCALLP